MAQKWCKSRYPYKQISLLKCFYDNLVVIDSAAAKILYIERLFPEKSDNTFFSRKKITLFNLKPIEKRSDLYLKFDASSL